MAYPVGEWDHGSNWEQNPKIIDITDKKLALPAIHEYLESSIPDTYNRSLNLLMVAGWVASTREDLLRTYEDRLTILGEPAQKTSIEIINSVHQAGQLRLQGIEKTNDAYGLILDSLLNKSYDTLDSLTERLRATISIKSAFLDGKYPSYNNHVIWSSTESLIKTTSIKLFKAAARSEYNRSLEIVDYELDTTRFDLEIFKNFARMPHWDNLMNDTVPMAREEIEAEKRFINWIRIQGRTLGVIQSFGKTALD